MTPTNYSRSESPVSVHEEMSEEMSSHFRLPSSSPPSQSIPITKGLYRTASEVQLCLDEEVAEQRDYAFYSRVLNGISSSQRKGNPNNYMLQRENQDCLLHIMQTRGILSTTRREQNDDRYIIGQSYETTSNGNFLLQSITSEALALAESAEEEEGIFELDL